MLLVLQIALGIVLAVVILRYTKQIAAFVILGVFVLAAVILLILGWGWANQYSDEIHKALPVILTVAFIAALVQGTAIGLAKLFIFSRRRVRSSPTIVKFMSLIGIRKEWIFTDERDNIFTDRLGGIIFLGLARFLCLYFLVAVFIWIGINITIKSLTHGSPYGPLAPVAETLSLVVGLLVPLLAIYFFVKKPRRDV